MRTHVEHEVIKRRFCLKLARRALHKWNSRTYSRQITAAVEPLDRERRH